MDMENPPGMASSVQRMSDRLMDIRQAELHNATVQATYVRHFRMAHIGENSVLCCHTMGFRALQLLRKIVLSMNRF
jgi:hypothetical protein